MSAEMKGEMVAQRISQSTIHMIYRLHTLYQPGGSAERAEVLRRLQAPREHLPQDTLEEVLKAVRAWPRLLSRCQAVNMMPPDASVLAKGLMGLTDRYIHQSTDAAFRTSMLRTSLRLDGQPTLDNVRSYQRHMQAELETMVSSASVSLTPQPKLKAVDAVLQPKAKDAAKATGGGGGELCRYFMKPSGCRRGERCTFSHSMASLDREQRAKKCLKCGAEGHRQRDCPVGKPKASSATSTSGKDKEKPGGGTLSGQSTMATVAASTASSGGDTIQGTPWTLETLMQAAQQVVQGQAEGRNETSPEKTKPEMRVLRLHDIRVCALKESTTALLDSGATHSLGSATSGDEWDTAEEVGVQLAGNHQLTMRVTTGGTLLMPPGSSTKQDSIPHGLQAQTIVPMGKLIETLGYTMIWSPEECVLQSPEGTKMKLQVHGGCPQMCELEALSLIARLEDRKLENLANETITTSDKLAVAAMAMEHHWDAPFFEDLPGDCLAGLVPPQGLEFGWDIMKLNGFFNRAQRRKLISSKRWVVHLFAGKEGHWEVFKLDKGDTSVIELDVARCAGHDILRGETWRMLLWGAKQGKVEVIFGGPPGRSQQLCRGGERDSKSITMVARMMWLIAVAQVGRELHGVGVKKDRDVGFVLEYPEGTPWEQRQAREREIIEAEDSLRDPTGRGRGALWVETIQYWEQVQRPRWENQVGLATVNANVSFWDTRMWKAFQRETQMRVISFDQGAMGGNSRNRTSLGTNVGALMSLDEVRLPEDAPVPERGDRDYVWAPGLVQALVVAMSFWHTDAHCPPRLHAMSAEQWKQHVDSNHAHYRKDCATCVMSRGVGRQHRRVHHPEAYVLTADVAGPLSPGLDPTSKGTLGKNLRYLMVAKYLVPKQFVEEFSGRPPPSDDGVGPSSTVSPLSEEQQKDLKELFGEEDVAEVEKQLPIVEVIDGPAYEEEHREIDPDEVAEYEPSEVENADEETKDQPPSTADVTMPQGDCVHPEFTYLTFAAALPNNQSSTVKGRSRMWCCIYRCMGYLSTDSTLIVGSSTTTDSEIGYGSRECMQRGRNPAYHKKMDMQASGLPLKLWPAAALAAAAEQRAKVLGWQSRLVAPFGSQVHLRRKPFDKAGPLRREFGLESKWTVGKYVGLSTVVHRGHLVYIPPNGEEKEKFLHTMHVRHGLIDPGVPEDVFHVPTEQRPRRRLTEKLPPGTVEMRQLIQQDDDVGTLAIERAQELLEQWSTDGAMDLIRVLASKGFFENRKFGVYRHGGTVGWLTGLVEYPSLTKLLTKVVAELEPEAQFTSVLVTHNTTRSMHKGFNNDYRTKNVVVPVQCPERGGDLWVELQPGDVVKGAIEKREVGKKVLYGQLHPLIMDQCISFGPQRYHEVCDWSGTRTAIIAYTPNCLGKLDQGDLESLHDHGFPVPLSQLPEFHGDDLPERVPQMASLSPPRSEGTSESEWTMFLDLDPGVVQVADARNDIDGIPQVSKIEVSYTHNIEDVLSQLSNPLDVTHTVRPEEVFKNMDAWKPAILKEVKGVEVAIERLTPGTEARRKWLGNPRVQKLPMKFVFTVKPNDKAVFADRSTWYKRKARLVICGNMATDEGHQVYTETAPAEAVRATLAMASKYKWYVAILDVVAAFLRTPLGRSPTDPVVVAQPPRLLEAMGISVKMELWGLVRALYGLREAPMLWGSYRDDTLRGLHHSSGLVWSQGKAITSWWTVKDCNGVTTAIVVVYVDDFMICGPREIVEEISEVIQQKWETSELTVLGPEHSIRFLGMELQRSTETAEEIHVFQQGYIQELLRLHGVKNVWLDKVPITKELAIIPDDPCDEGPETIRAAQQLTGEVLWVSQRTRPDLSYTTCVMASLCTRRPSQTIKIGLKTLGYLQRTINHKLVISWKSQGLMMFSDASFAPQGDRSHSGWLITYGGVPLAWRSSRQNMITLSTAECELLALLEGAVATKSTEALLADIGERVESRTIATDSTALSISTGSSSWRTRHLRIKAGWLQEQINAGIFTVIHWPGERQPADLLTKALSSARMEALLWWWNIGERGRNPTSTTTSAIKVSARSLLALVCCLLIVSAKGTRDSHQPRGSGLQVDWDTAGILMILLMVLGSLMVWEGVRWLLIEVVNEWTPGSQQRKLRRLRRLQQATTEAIEKELELATNTAVAQLEEQNQLLKSKPTLQVIRPEPKEPKIPSRGPTPMPSNEELIAKAKELLADYKPEKLRQPASGRTSSARTTAASAESSTRNSPRHGAGGGGDLTALQRARQQCADVCVELTSKKDTLRR
ncbi:Retrovirus-related Pol polyprotein from transposon TNT 1-94 [Symbiodinium microadriaticum]|uniref:Retrovirus-related Pol polyprotein from transposon TNT 1-94 n=1 Tax=Symbiodinium microadriaticum TaxID=2951 RepID=A0A1Q9DQI9_SYMMI|nr:Retrovirus-related Pol polyprotein from transposon TNT 1-94 [Symbiodinium microadriaticum]